MEHSYLFFFFFRCSPKLVGTFKRKLCPPQESMVILELMDQAWHGLYFETELDSSFFEVRDAPGERAA